MDNLPVHHRRSLYWNHSGFRTLGRLFCKCNPSTYSAFLHWIDFLMDDRINRRNYSFVWIHLCKNLKECKFLLLYSALLLIRLMTNLSNLTTFSGFRSQPLVCRKFFGLDAKQVQRGSQDGGDDVFGDFLLSSLLDAIHIKYIWESNYRQRHVYSRSLWSRNLFPLDIYSIF